MVRMTEELIRVVKVVQYGKVSPRVTIPTEVAKRLNILDGTKMLVFLDEKRKRIIYTPVEHGKARG